MECGDLSPLLSRRNAQFRDKPQFSSSGLQVAQKRREVAWPHSILVSILMGPFDEPVILEIKDSIDLHTIPPKQVKAVVEEYLIEARKLGYPLVRIIHG